MVNTWLLRAKSQGMAPRTDSPAGFITLPLQARVLTGASKPSATWVQATWPVSCSPTISHLDARLASALLQKVPRRLLPGGHCSRLYFCLETFSLGNYMSASLLSFGLCPGILADQRENDHTPCNRYQHLPLPYLCVRSCVQTRCRWHEDRALSFFLFCLFVDCTVSLVK